MQCTVAQNVRRYGARSAGRRPFYKKVRRKIRKRCTGSKHRRFSADRQAVQPRQIGQNGKRCALYIFRRRALIPSDFTTHGVCFFWIRAKNVRPARQWRVEFEEFQNTRSGSNARTPHEIRTRHSSRPLRSVKKAGKQNHSVQRKNRSQAMPTSAAPAKNESSGTIWRRPLCCRRRRFSSRMRLASASISSSFCGGTGP